MKGRSLAGALLLAAASALAAAPAADPPAPPVALEPPPGWTDVTAKTKGAGGVLLAFKGPAGSSFVVARMPADPLGTAAATRSYLRSVFEGLRAGSRLDYRTTGRIETKTFRNGVTAHLLRADLGGRPRLVIAALESGGPPVLGTLSSAAPDAMMGPLFGGLQLGAPGGVQESGTARSLDSQLVIQLGGGLRARDLTGPEIAQNVVLAIQGAGSEAVFLKLGEEDLAPQEEPDIVRQTVADAAKVPLASVSAARRAATPAGPSAVYAWSKIAGSPDLRFAAGFLPWSYWGYSILARGPQADELLVGALAALKLGPAGVPKMVAATPVVDLPEEDRRRRLLAWGGAAAAVLAAAFAFWSRGRKISNLPQ